MQHTNQTVFICSNWSHLRWIVDFWTIFIVFKDAIQFFRRLLNPLLLIPLRLRNHFKLCRWNFLVIIPEKPDYFMWNQLALYKQWYFLLPASTSSHLLHLPLRSNSKCYLHRHQQKRWLALLSKRWCRALSMFPAIFPKAAQYWQSGWHSKSRVSTISIEPFGPKAFITAFCKGFIHFIALSIALSITCFGTCALAAINSWI